MSGFGYVLYPLLWALGLKYLYLYGIFALYFKRGISDLANAYANKKMFYLLAISFLFYQLLSTVIGVYLSEVPLSRFIGIIHNYFVYCLFVVFSAITLIRGFDAPFYTIFIAGFCALIYLISSIFGLEVLWHGIFGVVVFVDKGYLDEGSIPRLSVFSDYYNATAILAIGVFYLLARKALDAPLLIRFLIFSIFLIVLLGTGSRLAVLLYFGLIPLLFVKDLRVMFFIYGLGLLLLVLVGLELYQYFDSLREDSSDTRKFIYEYSIEYVNAVNPYTGLGFKPKFDWMKYPVGSHSSFVGYYVKNGFVGIIFWVSICLYVLIKAVANLLNASRFKRVAAFDLMVVSILFIFFGFEDMDAFELNAIFLGVVVGNILKGDVCEYRN